MQAIKDKWKTYRSYKKVQNLWNDYKKVSHLHDNPETLNKFELFVDTMQGYLRNMASKNQNTSQVDNVFGHCNEMMSSMIQFLNQYRKTSKGNEFPNTEKLDELLAKVLEIVEYILKDPKYRKEIQNSPQLLQSFIDLMETVDKGESSTFLIKIIILMSENIETKIEFGKQQGFKKLFDLLEKKDEETSRLILKALIHFLNLKHSKTHSRDTSRLLEELDTLSNTKKEEASTISNKLKSIAGELRKMAFGELDRVFPRPSSSAQGRKDSLVESPRLKDLEDDRKISLYENLPTYEAILAFDLSQVHRDLSLIPQDFEISPHSTQIRTVGTAEEKEPNASFAKEDSVKELIVDQGALMALSNSLTDSKNEGDLILVSLDTLQQLLYGNKKLREEFKKVNGYANLAQIFTKSRNYDEIKNFQFLESAFKALQGFILDNNHASVIQDYEAFSILLNVISISNDPDVITQALLCLGNVLKTDWKNLVITIRMSGFGHLSNLIWRVSKAKALPPDSFTIGLLSNFTNLDEVLEIDENRRDTLLDSISEIFSMMSALFGVMNIDAEIIYADFASALLLQADSLATYFLANLLNFVEAKTQNVGVSVITLDDHLDSFIKVITDIFHLFATSPLVNNSPEYEGFFIRMLAVAEKILRSDHTGEGGKAQEDRNTSGDQSGALGQFKNFERRSPFKTQSPQFDFNIVYKNVFAEIKSYISYKFSEILLNEKPQFKSIFSALNYEEATKPEKQEKNLLILRILKCLLLANPKLMEAFEKLNGSSLWMGVILRLYEKSEYNNKNLVEMLSFLFDILLDRNNVFDLLKCYSTRNLEEIPIINVSKIQYLGVIEDILVKSKFDDEIAIVIDIISGLLNHAENKRIFKENGGLNFLFNVMLNFKSTANNFYTQTLTVFEQLITKFQAEDVDLFFETFFHPDFLKNKNLNSLFIDLLSFLSVHVALNSNPVILDRILTQEHYYSLTGLLDHSHSGVLDMTLKFLNVIFTSSTKLKKHVIPNKSKFTPLFIDMMRDVEPSQDLLQSVFELVFNNMDNIDVLYPPNTSNVSSILNRSSIADLIIQNSAATKSQPGKTKAIPSIASFEFLEVFTYLLSKCKDENVLYLLWKQFGDNMDSTNTDKVAESNFIVWVAGFLENYDLNVNVFPKFIDEVLSIIAKMLFSDLLKQKNSKIVEILKKIEDEDTLIYVVIRKLLERISQNPVIKSDTNLFLKNLAHFFSNIDDIIGIKPEILTLMLHCINILASKNTGEIRSAMKTQNLFEFRDNLLMQLLKFNLKSTSLYNIMKDFSFEAIANQSKFREAHIISYLVRILLTNEDYLNLQLLILRILKEDIAVNDENVKYVTKIIENPTILLYLYPNFKQKSSSVIRCFTSATANSEGRLGHDLASGSQITPETSSEDFLRYLNSEAMEGERKQIILKTNVMLIPIENDLSKIEIKFSNKKATRKAKSQDSNAKDRMNIQKFISETQLKVNQRFSKNQEKSQQKAEVVSTSFNNKMNEVNEALDRYISKL